MFKESSTVHDDFDRIACQIGDKRLAMPLRRLANDWIKIEIANAKLASKRSTIREAVTRLRAQARKLEIALQDTSAHLLDLPIRSVDCLPKAKAALQDVADMCNLTLASIPAKGGRPKTPGRVTCALIVIEAWAYTRGGRFPGHNNVNVHEACENYWLSCNAEHEGEHDGDWRRHIDAAKKTNERRRRYIRNEIARAL